MDTESFPGAKRPGHGVDHPPPSSVEVKERVRYTSTPLWDFVACSMLNFIFYDGQHCNSLFPASQFNFLWRLSRLGY